jgi:ERCC4-type nuclease
MRVIVDTREQTPFSFHHERFAGTVVEVGTLDTGDYSLAGLTSRVAVERKSLPDLVGCLSGGRARFERELQRAVALDAFAVVIEAVWADLAGGKYRSQMNPHSACQSVASFMARYRVPFVFCGSRSGAEYVCWSFLRQYLEGARKRLKSIIAAHDAA